MKANDVRAASGEKKKNLAADYLLPATTKGWMDWDEPVV